VELNPQIVNISTVEVDPQFGDGTVEIDPQFGEGRMHYKYINTNK
jgi:hypothetical protein